MRNLSLSVVTLAALSLGALAGCAGPGAPADPITPEVAAPVLPNALVFGEFVAHLSPKNHSFTIERVSQPRAYGPTLEPQSLDSLPILNDGTSGSGPANSVELDTTAYNDNYPGTPTFDAMVDLRHFYSRSFANVYVYVSSITDTSGNALANHDAINSDASQFGLSNAHGLWQYTASGAAPGVLAKSPFNVGTRQWIFANPDDADTNITFVVYGSLGFGSYSEDFSGATYIDACTGGTTSAATQVVTTIPFDFTMFNTNNTGVKFTKQGKLALGSTSLGISGTPVALPSTGAPHPALFPFWDGLTGGQMCYKTVGTAPARQFVVEWKNMNFVAAPGVGSSLDFEAILSEGTSNIDVVYNSMVGTGTSAGRENGAKATVGIQDETGTVATGEFQQQNYGTGNAYSFIPSPF
jgi:hypothetical protein